jgi:N-acetylmuramoyl-L-alanine amidase
MTRLALTALVIAALGALAAAAPELRVPAAGSPPRLRPVVVLDPGHGGTNAGAAGAVDGVHEKQVTLAITRRLAAALEARGVEVILTRDGDRTMTLRQRMIEANRRAADVFVSVHVNASAARTQRGFETFVLTPTGVDVDARALRSDAGTPRGSLDARTAEILDDVERGAAQWEAAELAATIQSHLRDVRGAEGDRGVRQDQQHVLLGATMPAVLVEVGFVDHPIEGRELVDAAVQEKIAGALADAIADQLAAR